MKNNDNWLRVSFNRNTGKVIITPIIYELVDMRHKLYYGSSTVFVFSRSETRGLKRLKKMYTKELEENISTHQKQLELIKSLEI